MTRKLRLDELLVERGLFPDIHDAQAAVLAGEVVVGEHRVTSAGTRVAADVPLRVKGRGRFVSRGGEKLAGALEAFSIDVTGLACADLGASSGGFTDCLLQAGAARVSAIDVNYGQFSWSLRGDERVSLYERTNVRGLDPLDVGGPFELVTGDLSFVSIRSLMPSIAGLVAAGGQLVMLVKPQFELAPELVGEGGIVREAALHEEAVASVVDAARSCGLEPCGLAVSPITGAKGNVEFLLHATRPAAGGSANAGAPTGGSANAGAPAGGSVGARISAPANAATADPPASSTIDAATIAAVVAAAHQSRRDA